MSQEERQLIQDKYEIVSKIKQGGFGIVYYGYDHVFEKPVAIKAIEPSLLREAKYVDLFLEEAKNAGKLSHNNIVHIYNLVRDENGQFFIVMEYIDGLDLGRILRQCRKKNILIPQELSIYIVKEICKALEYAHNKRDLITDKPLRLVHQDISPSNIMASTSGLVKLIDFGLAKIRFQDNNSNQVVLSGKLPYMTPEQVNGGTTDRRTDIFSLGTVFYEMLTGSRLFPLEDPQQTIELIKKSSIDTSLLDKNNVPKSLQKILLKMLQKNPENRYHGANGVYLDLVECLMTTTPSVELSEELGEFVRQLIDFDSSSDGQQKTVSSIASGYDEKIDEKQEIDEILDLKGGKEELSESEQVDIQKPGDKIFDLSEQSVKAISELRIDARKKKSDIDSTIKDLDSKDLTSAKNVTTEEVSSIDRTKSNENDIPNSMGNASEHLNEYPYESDDDGIIIDDKPLEDLLRSTSDEEEKPQIKSNHEILDEVKKILDSEFELNQTETAISKKSKKDSVIVDKKKIVPSQIVPSVYREEEGEDDLKTVIDVIRLSTKRYKKHFTIGGISVLSFLFFFLILDIMFQMTSLGEGIYNHLFPPAIRISSVPTGAEVYLNNKRISGKTPISIPKIKPGVHELKLTYSGFSPLIKSIHVPSKGEIKVAGENVRKGYDPYLFRFKTQIELDSDPRGATVYINQIIYPQKTPTTIEWDVSIPLSIEMEQDGFQQLSGFTLRTLDGVEEIEDRRLWSFNTIESEGKRYYIEGKFKKFIPISSIPSGVTFRIDGSPTPSGRTDVSNVIALSMGRHEILFTKDGFNSKRVRINVNKGGPESISLVLTRNVRFFAKDKTDPESNEIRATVVKIIQNKKSYNRNDRTPCEIGLPPVNLKVVLRKDGYEDAIVNVSPRDKDVVVKMELSITEVEIVVKDALTGLPLKDAQISYRSLISDQAPEEYYGATDENGKCINKIQPGEYSFKVKKFGFFDKYAIMNTKSGENKLEFRLIIQ